jgi:uncharacterized membrane protein
MQITNSEKAVRVIDTPKCSLPSIPYQKRINAFDLARGIAILSMVTIHTVVFVGSSDLTTSFTGYFLNSIICILAAPVFMFVMGILFSLSSRVSFKSQIYRGLSIIAIGYILNFFRGTIPVSTGLFLGWIDNTSGEQPLSYLLEDDILQFAGIAFIFMALVKKVSPWKYSWILLGCIVGFVAPLLWNKGSDQPVINYLMSLFTGSEHYNYFPFFPWIALPLFGMAYGDMFRNANDKEQFFNRSVFIGIILMITGIVCVQLNQNAIWEHWYHGMYRQGRLPAGVVLIFTGFQCIWIWLCNWITIKLPQNRFLKRLYYWSNNVTSFYNIQWLIIGWMCVILPELEWPAAIISIVLVTFFTDYFVTLYIKSRNKFKRK